jgi:competence protein ComEC
MRLPAVAIAAAFACGILMGLHPAVVRNAAETLPCDVLKVGHHGSKNSTIPEFLAAVQPRFAIISAGEFNPYGHPHAALLERLEKTGAVILRRDRDGPVRVVTDGERLEIACFVA